MVTQDQNSGRTKPKTTRRGLMRDVLVNWLRHDTSIFHDSFPATEANVQRVILELEQFPECYAADTGTFSVDKVAEWVRVNAAPFAERMEPPPFLASPAPEAAPQPEIEPAPAGAPPGQDELDQIHIESAVWDKMDMATAMEMMEQEGIAPEGDALIGDWKPGEEIVTQVLPGGFVPTPPSDEGGTELLPTDFVGQGIDDRSTHIMDPSELPPGLFDEDYSPAATQPIHLGPGAPGQEALDADSIPRPQAGGPGRPQAGSAIPTADGLGPSVDGDALLEEVAASLGVAFTDPNEAVGALGSAYRGIQEGLGQLMTELRSLTGREMSAVKDPALQVEAVRGAVRETIDGLRKQLRARAPSTGASGFGRKDLNELLVVVPKDVVEAVKNAGVEPDDPKAFLRALVERLGATARENQRLRDEMDKMKAALERQFKVTQQIKLAWKKIADELEEYKQHKTLAREKTEGV